MARIIKLIDGRPQIVTDSWQVIGSVDELASRTNGQDLILPLAAWEQRPRDVACGVWIGPDDDFETALDFLNNAALIAVNFPSFRDGRSLSVGHLLRTRHDWRGELRAIGDVLRDQLRQMRRCGFDTFAIRVDKDIDDALKGLTPRPIHYQGAADDPTPLFRRRTRTITNKI